MRWGCSPIWGWFSSWKPLRQRNPLRMLGVVLCLCILFGFYDFAGARLPLLVLLPFLILCLCFVLMLHFISPQNTFLSRSADIPDCRVLRRRVQQPLCVEQMFGMSPDFSSARTQSSSGSGLTALPFFLCFPIFFVFGPDLILGPASFIASSLAVCLIPPLSA